MASIKDKEAKIVSWYLKRERPMGSFKAAMMMHLPSSQLLLLDIFFFVTWHLGLVLAIQKQHKESQDIEGLLLSHITSVKILGEAAGAVKTNTFALKR